MHDYNKVDQIVPGKKMQIIFFNERIYYNN